MKSLWPAMFAGLFASVAGVDWDVVTDLDAYVHSDDGYFSWTLLTSHDYIGVTVHVLNMTSQLYVSESFTSQPIWWHIMGIAVPDEIDYLDFGILYIGGQSNDDATIPDANDLFNVIVSTIANSTRVVCGYVQQVPNQPIVFANDPTQRNRSEDDFIAWTWRTYLDATVKDSTVIARMPMTKAAKRALDTMQEFAQQNVPGLEIQRFGVLGGSKRGWTTWSLAATDQRVVVMMPFVFSLLNMEETLMNHYRNLDGAWSFAFQPYYEENVTQELFNPETQGIYDVEDMHRFRERFTIPLLLSVASGDEFFLCDESLLWWNSIPSPNKFITMIPNAEHTLAPHYLQLFETLISFVVTYLQGIQFPVVWWQINPISGGGGEIILHTNPPPVEVKAYTAVTLGNDTRRDFRLAAGSLGDVSLHPVWWRQNITIEDLGDGAYRAVAEEVEGEWRGFFIEGTWDGPTGERLVFTTQVSVVPNTYPHEPCTDAASCYGTLV